MGIRKLRDDEPIPDTVPRRYRNSDGYIRLRWLVAPNEYIEAYEHRVVAGRPPPNAHVHHLNGDKADNRPENLRVLTPDAHGEIHAEIERGRRNAVERPPTQRELKRARSAARRKFYADRAMAWHELYTSGLTQPEIAKMYGVDNSQVSRALSNYPVIADDG